MWKLLVLTFCALGVLLLPVEVSSQANFSLPLNSSREEKFFPIFNIVRFDNTPCISKTPGENGTCYTRSQCRSLSGTATEPCAGGFGVCCVFNAGCETTVMHNNTYFRSPNHSLEPFKPDTLELCKIVIQKTTNVCQIRLDFLEMELGPPDMEGVCKSDMLKIYGVPGYQTNLCGSLTGQHMYLDYGRSDRINLDVVVDGAGQDGDRKWNVRITYLECNSLARAPDGCLQYFQQSTGRVEMFNYPNPPHLANMDYTVCIRKHDGACSIVWTPCPSSGNKDESNFLLTGGEESSNMKNGGYSRTESRQMYRGMFGMNAGDSNSVGSSRTPAGEPTPSQVSTPLCMTDYVTILTDMSDRFCGNTLGPTNVIKSNSRPFTMRVRTNEEESKSGDMGNTGFCLMWRQEPCS